MQVIHVSRLVRCACCCILLLLSIAVLLFGVMELYSLSRLRKSFAQSAWLVRKTGGSLMLKYMPNVKKNIYHCGNVDVSSFSSPYIKPKGTDKSGSVYNTKLPKEDVIYKKIGFYDPLKENQGFLKTEFESCQYSKCKMTRGKESADAMIFLIAKLKHAPIPGFKRSPSQYWILKSDEAPSRFSWFQTLKRPGLREAMNWTLTHKSDSDIPVLYGKLTEKNHANSNKKDYSKIYDAKSKMAAWFVSHCPVRSRRGLYVDKMTTRINVDIFGKCGTKSCGMAEKVPGVVGMRQQADNETCFPMLSADYFFYLAFENSLCQEYITEKFFKLFQEVDIVPVVRGGADYKKYFPENMFVDAAEFSSPESLADFLYDLAADKHRYLQYLSNKNTYRYTPDHPDWQCKVCEKLHTDRRMKTYPDVHSWWTDNSCHDAMDSEQFH